MDIISRWWNGQWGRLGRRDIWLTRTGDTWHVRARHGGAEGGEVCHDFTREYEAHAMVDRLKAAAPGRWKDITRLLASPEPADRDPSHREHP